MPDEEIVSILRDIRDTQRHLWKLAVEAEARNKATLEQIERVRRSRRVGGALALVGWLVIVALLALQTSMMWSESSNSGEEGTTPVVHTHHPGNNLFRWK
jgi:hypothetical protein